MKTLTTTLKNGLKVMAIDTKAFPSVTTLLLVGAGSRYENKKNNGIAHFFEHMAFKGSKKYPNSMVLASTIEGFGGVFNAFTGKDHTGYWIKAPVKHFDTMVDVIGDMIQHSLLQQEEIEREKGVIVEEINMYEDTPMQKVGELYEELLYKKNPLGYHIAGSKETVTKFDRSTFIDYMNSLYLPSNSLFVIAGGLSSKLNGKNKLDDYVKTVEDKFRNWGDGKKPKYPEVKENQKKPNILIKHKKTEQAHFCLGFRAYSSFDDRKYALIVLSTFLGGGMSSRLFHEIREKRGLCYYISSSTDLYQDVGTLVTQAGVPIIESKVKEAIETALNEHKKIAEGNIDKKELKRVKELIKGRLILSMEDSEHIAVFFGKKLLLNKQEHKLSEILSHIDNVKLEDIEMVAKDIFVNKNLNFAMIGPFEDPEKFADSVHI